MNFVYDTSKTVVGGHLPPSTILSLLLFPQLVSTRPLWNHYICTDTPTGFVFFVLLFLL